MGADWFVCIQAVFLRGSLVSRESVLGVGADWFVGVQAVFLLRQPGVAGVCLGRGSGLVCRYTGRIFVAAAWCPGGLSWAWVGLCVQDLVFSTKEIRVRFPAAV